LNELLWSVLSRDQRAWKPAAVETKRRTVRTTDTAELVLRFKGEPMRVADIHAACEQLLEKEVPYHSLRSALSEGAKPGGRFVRLGYGMYRLREVAKS
jgi:hypothetical protein